MRRRLPKKRRGDRKVVFDTGKIQEILNDEKNRFYVTVGVTFLVGALYVVFAVIPKMVEFYDVTSRVGVLKRDISFVAREGKRIDKLKDRFDALKEEDEKYSAMFLSQEDVPMLLEEFASIAKNSEVNIQSISPYEVKAEKPAKTRRTRSKTPARKPKKYFDEMSILITAKSGYHQLAHFINELEEGGRMITITDLQIQNDKADPWQHKAKIALKTYVALKQEKE